MVNKYLEIFNIKNDLSEALISRIENSEDISQISLKQLSVDTMNDTNLVFSIVNDVNELLLYWFNQQVSIILMELVADFSEDKDASTKEKILETLMSILEGFANKRHIVGCIYEIGSKDVSFGTKLGIVVYNICDRILAISGDEKQDTLVTSTVRSVRVKGLMGLLIKVIPGWLEDDSKDLSVTLREVDQSLLKASEWAENFKIL